jgi:hypothetical protein
LTSQWQIVFRPVSSTRRRQFDIDIEQIAKHPSEWPETKRSVVEERFPTAARHSAGRGKGCVVHTNTRFPSAGDRSPNLNDNGKQVTEVN